MPSIISSWRKRRAARRAGQDCRGENTGVELILPNHFKCPISLDLMKDPVTLSTGITYDRENIEKWIESGKRTCPITKQTLQTLEPTPNHAIRKMIQDWCVENQSYGVERIPTPRVPLSSSEASEVVAKLVAASTRRDRDDCQKLAAEIKELAKESDRNRRRLAANGGGAALAAAFEAFPEEETLSALTLMCPLDDVTKSRLGSVLSLNSLVLFLGCRDLSVRRDAVLVLKGILASSNLKVVDALAKIEGATEALAKLISEPICPTTTRATMTTIYYMISNHRMVGSFIELGLVDLLIETLVDESDKRTCERELAVLDGLCSHEEGRGKASNHALTVPILAKKLHRVSDLATEFSVSILWKLGKGEEREEEGGGFAMEALQVGAFQKLLLLLQVGCGDSTREKVNDLLRLLNMYRERLEYIDSMDFKHLKRPF
ncbi:Ubiquitin--protein ligase [Bertholletia excelsa]